MGVDRGTLFHGGVDVGDGDENLHHTARHRLRNGELVEVAGIVVVDRGPEETAQVADRRAWLGGGFRAGLRLRQGRRREVRQQAMLDHCPTGNALEPAPVRDSRPNHLEIRRTAVF